MCRHLSILYVCEIDVSVSGTYHLFYLLQVHKQWLLNQVVQVREKNI